MRKAALGAAIALLLLVPETAGAQAVAQDFAELARTVGTGDRVHVFDLAGREIVGPIAELTTEVIVIGGGARAIRLDRARVVLVRKDRQDSIANGVLIGAGAKILGNIEIGEGSLVAAGSVVLKPVPPHTTVAGVPAKVVGQARSDAPAREMDQILAERDVD